MSAYYGRVIELERAGYRAVIGCVGATILSLTHDGRDLVLPADPDALRQDVRGTLLAPWPNRIDGGTYTFNGNTYTLPLNEHALGNASHGLVMWNEFEVVSLDECEVTLRTHIVPQVGYPWRVSLLVRFKLDSDGLTQQVTATNLCDEPAPYGLAAHPYLVAGTGCVDEWVLTVPARSVTFNDSRNLPCAIESLDAGWGVALDFRTPKVVGGAILDNAFTDLSRDEAGRAVVSVVDSESGRGTQIEFGAEFGWVQVYSHDFAEQGPVRRGLAVEPMTCPANAFVTGKDLFVLEPAGKHVAQWRISAV